MSGQKQKNNSSGLGSFLFGAVAGAALAAGTYYLASKDEPCAQSSQGQGQSRSTSAPPTRQGPPRPVVTQSDKSDEKETEQECSICLESFGALKKIGVAFMALECGHVICSHCLEDLKASSEENVNCPVCRKQIKNQEIRRVYF